MRDLTVWNQFYRITFTIEFLTATNPFLLQPLAELEIHITHWK
jgi:hypothetical protein